MLQPPAHQLRIRNIKMAKKLMSLGAELMTLESQLTWGLEPEVIVQVLWAHWETGVLPLDGLLRLPLALTQVAACV